jgi:iron complex transport system permease protein
MPGKAIKTSGKGTSRAFSPAVYLLFIVVFALTMTLCVTLGSVSIPFWETVQIIAKAISSALFQTEPPSGANATIIIGTRVPRVLCAALVGAALSIAGCAMQGLLKNPLADGTTLGVSSGATLGAVIAISFGLSFSALPLAGTMVMASLFAFLSLLVILTLAYRLDRSLSTDTIILIGIIFGMFMSAIISVLLYFAGEQASRILFWTMGSMNGKDYTHVLLITGMLAIFSTILLMLRRELNAFAVGEDNARHIGINVKRVKLLVLIAVSALVGTCVSVGGIIGFVGLVTPHMVRRLTGPNHTRLLPASLFGGAVFLMLSDLVARTIFNPLELPIGVVTSLVGAMLFIYIFFKTRSTVK